MLEAVELDKQFRLGRGRKATVVSAVNHVSLELRRGRVVALVGESGSGKTTVARLLAGQERRSGGQILLDGKPIEPAARRGFRAYKGAVQMVFQDPFASLNPLHTVSYHLTRALRLHADRSGRDPSTEELDKLLDQVRLTPAAKFRDAYPHELSGGQRQRVAIARALATAPRVLLADEPVSMLDVSIRLEMLDLIDQLRQKLDLAVLYITHDIASARYFADEIVVMYAGEIVERGPAEQVTQAPSHEYTRLLIASAPDPDAFGRAAPRPKGGSSDEVIVRAIRGLRHGATSRVRVGPYGPLKARAPGLTRGHVTVYIRDTTLARTRGRECLHTRHGSFIREKVYSSMKRWIKQQSWLAACAALGAAALIAGCGGTSSSSSGNSGGSSGHSTGGSSVLTVESSQQNSITQDFNPFVQTSAATLLGTTSLLYEPLLQTNAIKPGQYYDWLATATAGRTAATRSRSRSVPA